MVNLVRDNLVKWWSLRLQVGCDQTGFMRVSMSIDTKSCVSIDSNYSISTDSRSRWSSWVPNISKMFQISPKCSKSITYLQNTSDLINIINRLYNIIIISKNTYKLWMKMGQIHSLSTPTDLPFCLSSSKINRQSL